MFSVKNRCFLLKIKFFIKKSDLLAQGLFVLKIDSDMAQGLKDRKIAVILKIYWPKGFFLKMLHIGSDL